MSLFDRIFGNGRKLALARAAELRGELAKAAELFGEAGAHGEAARILLLRADGETEPRARLQFLAQAAQVAPAGAPVGTEARRKRAALVLALAGDATVSAVARHDVLEAARELEAVGEPLKAAEAYARAGDQEGEARALSAAGDVERLEFLLGMEQTRERSQRRRDERVKNVDMLLACGRRREALATLEELLEGHDDPSLRDRASTLRARRLVGPVVAVEASGARWSVVLGAEVVVGRTEGAIRVPTTAVSRQHLRIRRSAADVIVEDLGSRNGTELRGNRLAGAFAINDGVDLRLGREVAIRIAPSSRWTGAVEIAVAGTTYVACLGPTRLPDEPLSLVAGADGWVEVTANSNVFLGDVEIDASATLLVGDVLSTRRGAPPALRILPP